MTAVQEKKLVDWKPALRCFVYHHCVCVTTRLVTEKLGLREVPRNHDIISWRKFVKIT